MHKGAFPFPQAPFNTLACDPAVQLLGKSGANDLQDLYQCYQKNYRNDHNVCLVSVITVADGNITKATAAYYAWFHASHSMATPGKMAVGIKVVRLSGERISLARGIGRYFATILSGLILGIGFLMAAFTDRKQALHDMICDTLVVDKWAFTATPDLQRRELGTVTVVVLAIFGVLLALAVLFFMAAVGWAVTSR